MSASIQEHAIRCDRRLSSKITPDVQVQVEVNVNVIAR